MIRSILVENPTCHDGGLPIDMHYWIEVWLLYQILTCQKYIQNLWNMILLGRGCVLNLVFVFAWTILISGQMDFLVIRGFHPKRKLNLFSLALVANFVWMQIIVFCFKVYLEFVFQKQLHHNSWIGCLYLIWICIVYGFIAIVLYVDKIWKYVMYFASNT